MSVRVLASEGGGGGGSRQLDLSSNAGGLNSSGCGTIITSQTNEPPGSTPEPPRASLRGREVSVTLIMAGSDIPNDRVMVEGQFGHPNPFSHKVVIVPFVIVRAGIATLVATVPYHKMWM